MNIFVELLIQITFAFAATVGFAVIINNPRKALLACGISGAAGWLVYWFFFHLGIGRVFSNFTAALIAGLLGLVFARYKKMPALLFNIPALVPLVPGVSAYKAVRTLVIGNMDQAIQLLVVVAMVTGAIALGYMVAQLINDAYFKIKKLLN